MGGKTVGKFRPIVCLNVLDGAGEGFYQMFLELGRRIGTMFLERLHKAPSGVLVNGCVLVLLSNHLAFSGRKKGQFLRLPEPFIPDNSSFHIIGLGRHTLELADDWP